ncbi:unnamed protein product [Menidia menidia]|uniref:(Atlantic silverside) hypothetical protein n=1 Tax=Menidia menidia TaxID=238744 RepID=A0A8S4AMW2_9TELE|nr:unnamed protein product [Menidia menidia]
MKAAVVFVLLFATVLCRPARKVSDSSSDSSEEVVGISEDRGGAVGGADRRWRQLRAARTRAPRPQRGTKRGPPPPPPIETLCSEEFLLLTGEAAAPVEVSADPEPTPDTASVDSQDSQDEDDKEEEETEEDETEEEEDDSSDSSDSESGESSTVSAVTVTPVVVTEEPVAETTEDPILPTIVTDPDGGRGDSLGGYPSDYKSIIYVEEKSYHKHPGPYKSYELLGLGKKVAYDMVDGNEVEKSPKAYKVQEIFLPVSSEHQAFQVHSDLLEEDTSTPEVESQGLDASSGLSQDQDISTRQAPPPEEEEGASASESESSSAPEQEGEEEEEQEEEEQEESASSSDSQEAEAGGSSEEGGATATPGATPGASDSDESDSAESDSAEEGGAGPEPATQGPEVVAAK